MAKDLDAIFQRTSAKESTGVEELFNKIGKKILDPSYVDNEDNNANNPINEKEKKEKEPIKLKPENKNESNKKKKGCC